VACWTIRKLEWIGNANLKFGIIYDLGQSDGGTVNGVTLGTTSQQWQWQRNGPSVSME
jgi:hypothetical protein